MSNKRPPTHFACPERASSQLLQRQIDYFSAPNLTRQLLDSVPNLLMILNRQRQIVYANQALIDLIASDDPHSAFGLRPGEILHCIHADAAEGGCGTAEACSTCGAVLAILAGLDNRQEVRECRITRNVEERQESLDLLVWATPLAYGEEKFTVLAVSDISHEKRRRVLERLFFHDILNVVGSIRGFAELLHTYKPSDREEIYALIKSAAEQTIEEIQAQRILSAAENQDLHVCPEPVLIEDILRRTVEIYSCHQVADGRRMVLDPVPGGFTMTTDRAVLGRILGNMIKNALEASTTGETVTAGCRIVGNRAVFSVHNPTVMPMNIQLQIFQRSFSTKGNGRGLGTYSLRLLSEYLQGEVSFTSSEGEGTTFYASYPLELE